MFGSKNLLMGLWKVRRLISRTKYTKRKKKRTIFKLLIFLRFW